MREEMDLPRLTPGEEMDLPRLTPGEERLPSAGRLRRRPEEMTTGQFDLLAAARAEEGVLSPEALAREADSAEGVLSAEALAREADSAEGVLSAEALAEMEEIFTAVPGSRERAESFRRLRLTPGTERWPGMRSALRPAPTARRARRILAPALLAAAAMTALVIWSPALIKLKKTNSSSSLTVTSPLSMAEIPAAYPIIGETEPPPKPALQQDAMKGDQEARLPREGETTGTQQYSAQEAPATRLPREGETSGTQQYSAQEAPELQQIQATADQPYSHGREQETELPREVTAATDIRPSPLTINEPPVVILKVTTPPDHKIALLTLPVMPEQTPVQAESNWIIRGISSLRRAVTNRDKEISSFMLARGFVKGINSFLGWEMELEQLQTDSGEPLAVSFNSSLLSFTRPLNKKESLPVTTGNH